MNVLSNHIAYFRVFIAVYMPISTYFYLDSTNQFHAVKVLYTTYLDEEFKKYVCKRVIPRLTQNRCPYLFSFYGKTRFNFALDLLSIHKIRYFKAFFCFSNTVVLPWLANSLVRAVKP